MFYQIIIFDTENNKLDLKLNQRGCALPDVLFTININVNKISQVPLFYLVRLTKVRRCKTSAKLLANPKIEK